MPQRPRRRLPVLLLPLLFLYVWLLSLSALETKPLVAAPETRRLEEEDIVGAIGLGRAEALDRFGLADTDDHWPATEYDSVNWPGTFLFEGEAYQVQINVFEGHLGALHLRGETIANGPLVDQARRLVGSRSYYYGDPTSEPESGGRLLTQLAGFEPQLTGLEAAESWLVADSYCGRPEIRQVCRLSISLGPGTGSREPEHHAVELSFMLQVDEAALESPQLVSEDLIQSLGQDRSAAAGQLGLTLPPDGWVQGDPAITRLPGLYNYEIYRYHIELETVGDILSGIQLNSGPLDRERLVWWVDTCCTMFTDTFGEALPQPYPGQGLDGLAEREDADWRQISGESWLAGEGPGGETILCHLGIRMISARHGEFYIRFELAGD